MPIKTECELCEIEFKLCELINWRCESCYYSEEIHFSRKPKSKKVTFGDITEIIIEAQNKSGKPVKRRSHTRRLLFFNRRLTYDE